ncbi:glycosyltransferase WbuB [Photobacterium rosenbergii]|uniref:Glycosyltransferase WbuB n=1 Tax=Photobacterium rosenbergii TaxID=294936 RepID=A0A2T3NBI1_9GAMM|nr:glycosyltransferase family 4 protein [Photobacterium rosenbergii]PSW11199.1 glycosyltransferase WbuB [Photobacterium rosenbergii]
MKILYLHQYFATPESNAGTRSYEMAKRLISKGHEVTFVTSSAYLSKSYNLKDGWNELDIEGIKLHVLHLPYSNNDSYLKRIIKFLQFSFKSTAKSLKVKSDVVFATSTPLTIAIPGLIYSKLKKVPLVFEVRDLWPELPVAVGAIKNPFLIKAAETLESYTYKNATRLVGLSPGMCEGIERHGIPSNKITLATNSCDTDLFDVPSHIGEDYITDKLSFLNGRKLITYTGTFGVINNVSYLVDLAEKSLSLDPSLCFVAIGEGMQKEDVISYAKDKGVFNKNLYILNGVPKTEIVKLLSAADLSLSLFGPVKEMWHNSANKLFDALASATPIAINYGGWQKDFIQEHNCGLVLNSTDYEEASRMLSDFINNSQAYNDAKDSCRNLAYNHFSRDIMGDRLEITIREAVDA